MKLTYKFEEYSYVKNQIINLTKLLQFNWKCVYSIRDDNKISFEQVKLTQFINSRNIRTLRTKLLTWLNYYNSIENVYTQSKMIIKFRSNKWS